MKKIKFFIIFTIFLLPFYHINTAFSDSISNPYCVKPPFIQANLPSNIMLVLDYSGSMSGNSYSDTYDSNKSYYGYFDKDSNYSKDSDEIYYKDSNGIYSGNELNHDTMKRIDILRWILTGGKTPGGCIDIKSCSDTYSDKTSCETNTLCEWRGWWFWSWCSNKYHCPSLGSDECSSNELCSSGESVVITYDKTIINKEDVSSYDADEGDVVGILQKIRKLDRRPRIGANFYGTDVYDRVGLSYEYVDLINKINNTSPYKYPYYFTATGPALADVENLYRRDSDAISNYGNVDPYSFGDETIWCARNFVLLMSDGEWNIGEDPVKPADRMWKGGKKDLTTLKNNQNVNTYPIAMFLDSVGGKKALKHTAIFGNYKDKNNNGWPCGYSGYPDTSLTTDIPLSCSEWDSNGDGIPDKYFEGDDPEKLKEAITKAFTEILKQVSSGTAASILASSEKSGANIMQAVFYPKQYFESGTEAEWIGKLQNLWFYLGPFTQNIREDTENIDCTTNDKCFNLSQDKVIEFYFDNSMGQTMVNICTDSNGNGRIDEDETCDNNTSLEEITPIWEAGKVLWETNPTDRKIFTNVELGGDSNTINKEDVFANATATATILQTYLDADNVTEASNIINYIRGEDISGKRSRTVNIGGTENVWKLGDIVYSTPKVVSSVPLNTYHIDYHDSTYRDFTTTTDYKNRGMVFVCANDGMLHAFRFGILEFPETGSNIAKLTAPLEGNLGSEAWGFIPQNILPYLKYYMEPEYCHLAYVDLSPYAFDASIKGTTTDIPSEIKTEDSWRTVLIGGLNFGGACGGNNTGAVHPPISAAGKSSYFALDVTNPENPQVLWEFTDNNTAFTTTGPAIIHIPYKEGDTPDNTKNGYWYAAFASGPDNYDGEVHQPLYLYVLDLKTGELKRKWQLSGTFPSSPPSYLVDKTDILGSINAFAGRFFESQTDLGINYSDDVMYFGYTYKGSSWDGGVLRLVTGNDSDPANWTVSKLIDGVGPVTSGVSRLEDTGNHNLWVYFGEGRYFTSEDDSDANRTIYGVKDPCYGDILDATSCTSSENKTNLIDVTDINNVPQSPPTHGWYINLDSSSGGYNAERVITDSVATVDGLVFYTTFMPTSDICGFGGNTYIWMVNYDNGGVPQNVGGTIFIQTSTGVIKKIELSKEFGTGKGTRGGRKLAAPIAGAPSPSSGITVIKPAKPIKSLIQWRETPIRKGE